MGIGGLVASSWGKMHRGRLLGGEGLRKQLLKGEPGLGARSGETSPGRGVQVGAPPWVAWPGPDGALSALLCPLGRPAPSNPGEVHWSLPRGGVGAASRPLGIPLANKSHLSSYSGHLACSTLLRPCRKLRDKS